MTENKRSCRRVSKLIIIMLLTALSIYRTASAQQEDKLVILEHADSLVGSEINGESVRELIGNVQFKQGNVKVRCNRAVQYLNSNKVSMEGEVEVIDDSLRMVGTRGMYYGDNKTAEAFDRVMFNDHLTTLRANYGKYFIDEKKAYFTQNVSVEDSASTLTADELTYFREEQNSIANSNVVIVHPSNKMTIRGNHFEHFKQKKYSRMTGTPKVIQIESNNDGTKDTLIVASLVLESYQDTIERLIATDSVTINRGGLTARAGFAVFMTELDSMVLRKDPIVWYATNPKEDNQVSGDSIFIKLKKRKLESVFVEGRACAISRADSIHLKRFNQMTGQEIVMHFDKDKLQQIDVDRTATSLYYLFDKGKANGMNKTSGDHVTITFSNGKIDKLKVVGGIEGQYFPEKLILNKEKEYNLPGFNWRDKKTGKVIDINR
jgi:lipopolysaccharide export system protein LptA